MKNKMGSTTDIYIKDEGDFATVVLCTPKAIKASEKFEPDYTVKTEEIAKFDIRPDGIKDIEKWAQSENLSVENDMMDMDF